MSRTLRKTSPKSKRRCTSSRRRICQTSANSSRSRKLWTSTKRATKFSSASWWKKKQPSRWSRSTPRGNSSTSAAAEVDEFPRGVERDHRLGCFFFHQLALENLVALFVEVQSFRLRDEFALVWQILRRELVHLLFDFGEVFLSERLITQEFVEKARVDGRTDAQLHVGIQLHHRSGEQMRRGMAEHKERIGISFREDLQLDVVIQRAAQVDQLAFTVVGRGDARHKGGIREPRRNTSRDVGRCRAFGHLFDAAIRQCDVNLLHLHVHLEGETLSLSAVFHAVKARQTNREHVGVKYSLGLNQRD